VALALLAAASAFAPAVAAAPADLVPRGHIAYDLLGSLAARGRLPGWTLRDFLRGDRLYTRGEVAAIVRAAREAAGVARDRDTALRVLEREFGPELRRAGEAPGTANPGGGAAAAVAGSLKVRLLTDPDAGKLTGRLAGVAPVGRDGYAAVSAGSWRSEWHGNGYPAIETAYVRVDGRVLDVSVGRMPLRWGPGYSGALLLGDEAPSVPMVKVEKSFTLGGKLGRRVGRLYFTQFAGTFTEPDVLDAAPNARGTRRYLLGRRLETQNESRWNLAFAESFKSTRLPDPHFALVLPFYTYQNDWTSTNRNRWFGFLASDPQPNTAWLNYLASINVSYRADIRRGTVVYGDLVLDDLKAPPGLRQDNATPRKIGALLGVYAPDLGGGNGRYRARAEIASIDPGTFTNVSPPVAWVRDGRPLGFPTGPNSRLGFVRLDARVSPRLDLALDAFVRRRARGGAGDGGADAESVGIYGAYALRDDAFVGARLDYGRVTPPGGPADRRTRFEINAAFGF
jgi:hypothetical protein